MSLPTKTRVFVLGSYPKGDVTEGNFKIREEPLPELKDNQVLVKAEYFSMDPYLRGRMTPQGPGYVPPFELNKPIEGSLVGRVIKSKSPKFKDGEYVGFIGPWAEYIVRDADKIRKLLDGVDPEGALHVVGMNGLTAYFGLHRVAKLKEKDTVVVTSAAGSVGYIVAKMCLMNGCNVIGLAGSEEKVKFLRDLGVKNVINYKSTPDLKGELQRMAPNGITVFWDNVGNELSDAIRECMANFGRIVQCGAISQYNMEKPPLGTRWEWLITTKRLKVKGFVVGDFHSQYDEALNKLAQWYREGKIPKQVTVDRGFENLPKSFTKLFQGQAKGKLLVRVE